MPARIVSGLILGVVSGPHSNSTSISSLKKCAYASALIASAVGVALSVYLSVQHTRLKSGIQEGSSFCSLGKYADCDVVSASAYSEIFGVPIASIGALFYFVVLLFLLLSPPSKEESKSILRWVTWLAGLALLIDLGLGVIQVAVIQSLCLLCALTYLCSAVLFFAAAQLQASQKLTANTILPEGLFLPSSAPKPSAPLLIMVVIASAAFGVLLFMMPQYLRMNLRTNSMDGFFASWREKEARKLPLVPGDATSGPADAKVQVVEYSDFECPHCKRAAFALHTFLKTKEGKVQFIFKNFPLDNACNGLLERPMHRNACALARLGRCANAKGKFFEFHDAVFFQLSAELEKGGSSTLLDAVKDGVLSPIFTPEEFHACLSDDSNLKTVKEDIQQGLDLGVKGTPALFINGNQVPIQINLENLNRLFDIENRR